MNKRVFFLKPLPEVDYYKSELEEMRLIILSGDLNQIQSLSINFEFEYIILYSKHDKEGLVVKIQWLLGLVILFAQADRPEVKSQPRVHYLRWFGQLTELDYPSDITLRSEGFEGEIKLVSELRVGQSLLSETIHRDGQFNLKAEDEIRLQFPERKLKTFTTLSLMIEIAQKEGKRSKVLLMGYGGRLAILKLVNFDPLPATVVIEFKTKTATTLEQATEDLLGIEGEGPAGWTIQYRQKEPFLTDLSQIAQQLFQEWPATARYYMFQGRIGPEITIRFHQQGYQINPSYGPDDPLRAVVFTKGFNPIILQRLEINLPQSGNSSPGRLRGSNKKS